MTTVSGSRQIRPDMQQPIPVEGRPSGEHPLYGVWKNMRQRCRDRNHPDYQWYGARGIQVCARWDSFALFVEDMAPRPPGHTLDREDNDGPYSPDNCRWATPRQQATNQRMRRTNTTGVPGVSRHPKGGYLVRATRNGKRVYVGFFTDLEAAKEARRAFEEEGARDQD